jgi:hypothetical protein
MVVMVVVVVCGALRGMCVYICLAIAKQRDYHGWIGQSHIRATLEDIRSQS